MKEVQVAPMKLGVPVCAMTGVRSMTCCGEIEAAMEMSWAQGGGRLEKVE